MPAIHEMTAITCSALIHGYAVTVIHSYIARRLVLFAAGTFGRSQPYLKASCQRGTETYPQCTASLTNNFRILGLSLSSGELDSQQTVPQFSRLVHIHPHFRGTILSFE